MPISYIYKWFYKYLIHHTNFSICPHILLRFKATIASNFDIYPFVTSIPFMFCFLVKCYIDWLLFIDAQVASVIHHGSEHLTWEIRSLTEVHLREQLGFLDETQFCSLTVIGLVFRLPDVRSYSYKIQPPHVSKSIKGNTEKRAVEVRIQRTIEYSKAKRNNTTGIVFIFLRRDLCKTVLGDLRRNWIWWTFIVNFFVTSQSIFKTCSNFVFPCF